MLSAIFQPEVNALESQVAALQAQIAAHTARITLLNDAEFLAGDSLEALKAAIHNVSSLAPSAVSNLRAAVLSLFGGDSNDDGNSNEPHPAPQPDDDGEAIAVEILTGQHTEWACPLASPLTSAFACCILEDAPRAALEVIPAVAESKPYVELVPVSDSVAYQHRTTSREIICAYLGGNNKSRLKDWGSWLCNSHTVGTGFELRAAERLTNFKYEIKIWGMSIEDIQKLAEADTTKSPASNYGNAPKRTLEPVAPAPKLTTLNDIGVGDIVRSITVKHWEYKVLGITENKFLDVERLGVIPQIRLGGRPEGFELVSKALTDEEIAIGNASIQPPEPTVVVESTPQRRKPIDDLFITNTAAATSYTPYPIGRAGAQKNWDILQAQRAEQRAKAQTAVLEAPQPAPTEEKIVSGDWVELLCNGDRYQVESIDSEGIHLLNDADNITVQADEIKLLLHIPDSWKPF